ncbi:hypothetical protein TrLO_g7090 [Triparma laevis f. longispina]|uniref:Uncharacterized protein n=1 Tax=Triparma laevis f. longispina TaxID=1714387 RepID=A0A9W7FS07_9STRA|nr:hypothetical protein TrLO_g7090 [Triparma laevis f. longispina]
MPSFTKLFMRKRELESLTVAEVSKLLERRNLRGYSNVVKSKAIDGEALMVIAEHWDRNALTWKEHKLKQIKETQYLIKEAEARIELAEKSGGKGAKKDIKQVELKKKREAKLKKTLKKKKTSPLKSVSTSYQEICGIRSG